jgi:hypothetical protein
LFGSCSSPRGIGEAWAVLNNQSFEASLRWHA